MQKIITLTTDFGYTDYYTAVLKGKIYSKIGECNLVDISHNIRDYHIEEAGFVLSAAYPHFPKETIHIVSVKAEITPFTPAICVKYDGHYFIATDNGVLSIILGNNEFEEAIYLGNDENECSSTVFADCARHLVSGYGLAELGNPVESLYKLNRWADNLNLERNKITGKVVYEDSFGNLITNITKESFERIGKGRKFSIRIKDRSINKINKYFADFKVTSENALLERAGELLATFNDLDLLLVTLLYSKKKDPGGSPKSLMNIQLNDNIVVEFEDEFNY